MREYTNGPTDSVPPFTPNPDPNGALCLMPSLEDHDKEFFISPPDILRAALVNLFQDVQVVPYTGFDVEGIRLTLTPVGVKILVNTLADNLLKALTLRQAMEEMGLSREEQLEFFMKRHGRTN